MILLTPAQAKRVRGISTEGNELDPRLMADGNFCLPEAVLSDPAHAQHRAFLSALPKVATPTDDKWEFDDQKIRAASQDRNERTA